MIDLHLAATLLDAGAIVVWCVPFVIGFVTWRLSK